MHTASAKLFALLKKAYAQYITQDVKRLLEKISEACEVCDEHSVSPFSFRATLQEENIIFSREKEMNIMLLTGKPVLYTVDVETNF